jgi:glycosyltransferase involved in cell wall biosynthesis
MLTIHLIAHRFPPARGGLEMWTQRFAEALSASGVRTIVYVGTGPRSPRPNPCGYEIRYLQDEREVSEEPISAAIMPPERRTAEMFRLNFLVLKRMIRQGIKQQQSGVHLLVSVFLTEEGFVAATLAQELGLPHLPIVVGSDFSRGFLNPQERYAIDYVVRHAWRVVTMNDDQKVAFERAYGFGKVTTIHPSVDAGVFEYRWSPPRGDEIVLFSDTGFSSKKGTQVLLHAFARLRKNQLPVKLIACGGVEKGQEAYWRQKQKEYVLRYGAAFSPLSFLELEEVWQRISTSHIYCSATLGEGCSHARTAALCIGIPVVTTRCGEMLDVVDGASHVRLAEPTDDEGFTAELARTCREITSGSLVVDHGAVRRWREYFVGERELRQFQKVLADIER